MPNGKTKNPRIAFVPSDHVLKTIRELSATSGVPMATIVSEIMDEAAVVMSGQLEAFKQIARAPERAREVVQDYANASMARMSQAVLDLDKPRQRPGPKPGKGRGAANTG